MKIPLVQYQVIIQYLEKKQNALPDRVTFDRVFTEYKKAKKECIKNIRNLQKDNRRILTAYITPVMLSENFYDGSQKER